MGIIKRLLGIKDEDEGPSSKEEEKFWWEGRDRAPDGTINPSDDSDDVRHGVMGD